MNFSTVQRVYQTIRSGDTAEWERGQNRVKINNQANCVPPLDPDLAKRMGLKINVNWGELMILLAHARSQYRTAFRSSQNFFTVTLPYAPAHQQSEWGAFITEEINRPMRQSLKYFELGESWYSQVVCHGQAPRLYYNSYDWCPDCVAIEDLRIPTDTTLDFEHLEWFGVRHIYSPGELIKDVFKRYSKWAKKDVARILKNKKEINWDYAGNNYDWDNDAEKIAELVKQDGGWWASDAQPGIPMWHFYFLDESDKENSGWFRVVIPAEGTVGGPQDKFLWQSTRPVAPNLSELLMCQFGDLSVKAPFNYHSIRSLGFALLEPTFYTNLTRCRLLQHVHDNFNIWLRTNDPIDKARAQVQEFGNFGVLRSGVSIVPQTERHQIQADLVESSLAQLKQLQQEASASYTQQLDTGTRREQTAFETSVKMQQVNAMLGGLLIKAFFYETGADREICRRFTLPKSRNHDVRVFQENCKKMGIPRAHLDSSLWRVERVTPLGMGNPTIAQAAAKQLAEFLPLLDPTAQQEAKHEIILTLTQDPRKAARWVPLGKGRGITDGARDAMSVFGTLMQGVPVPPREGLPAIDQVEAMIPLLAGKITVLTRRDNMATADEFMGLQTVAGYIETLIQRIAQNRAEKDRVKKYGDDLGKLMNEAKALAQRGAQAKASQNGGNGMSPEAAAKIHATMATGAAKVKATEDKAKQQQRHKEQAFIREQRRQDANTFAEIQRQNDLAKAKNRMKSFDE